MRSECYLIKNTFLFHAIILLLLLSFFESAAASSGRKGIPVGITNACKITISHPVGASGYDSNTIYDIKVTTLDILRGEKANKKIQQLSKSFQPPEKGLEYLLIRIKISVDDTGSNDPFKLKQDHFKIYDKSDTPYSKPDIAFLKNSLIDMQIHPGNTYEGWIPFLVSVEHKQPFMFFSCGRWFQLF